jgi:hypothetical protein
MSEGGNKAEDSSARENENNMENPLACNIDSAGTGKEVWGKEMVHL